MTQVESRHGARHLTRLAVALAAVLYLISLSGIDLRGFWVLDNAVRFLQMESILRSHYTDYSIPIAGAGLDPDLRMNPIPFPFTRLVDGKVYPVFPPAFALLSTLPYRLFGYRGLYVLPFLSTLLLLLGVARITAGWIRQRDPRAGRAERWGAAAALLVGFGSPIWFYSAVFWEHATATCLLVWSTFFHLRYRWGGGRRRLVQAMILAGAASWFREECLLLGLLLLAGQFLSVPEGRVHQRCRDLLAGAGGLLAPLAALWAFQAWTVGRPFGLHVENIFLLSTLGEHLRLRPQVFYHLLLALSDEAWVSILLAAPVAVFFFRGAELAPRAFRLAVPAAAALASVGSILALSAFFGPAGPIAALDRSNSLLTGVPWLALGLCSLRPARSCGQAPRSERWLLRILGLFVLSYVLLAPANGSRGIHWGCRFLLVLYPLLGSLAVVNLSRWTARGEPDVGADPPGSRGDSLLASRGLKLAASIVIGIAIVVGLGAQAYSIRLLARMNRFSVQLNQAVGRRPESVILATSTWVPAALHQHFFDRQILLAHDAGQVDRFVDRLVDAGQREFLYLTTDAREIQGAPVVREEDGLRFFAVYGYPMVVDRGP